MKPERLGAQLRDLADEETLAAVWSDVQHSRERRRRRRVTARVAVVVAVLVAGGFGALSLRRSPGPLEPLTLADAAPLTEQLDGTLALSDASRVVVEPGSRLQLVGNAGPRVQFHLREGRARFEVTPGTGRQWEVAAGELSVEVVGTVFSVERRREVTLVVVERGAVLVRGARVPDHLVRLVAGQRFELPSEVPPPKEPTSPEQQDPPPTVLPRGATAGAPPSDARGTAPRASAPPPPRADAQPSDAREEDEPGAMLLRADAERRGGRVDDAMHTLAQLIERHPRAPEAALAAFTLGQLARTRGDTATADAWLSRALELGLPAPLAATVRDGGS